MVYEIKCTPPNERSRVVTLEAHSIEEALARASRLWMHQAHPPMLLAIIDTEPQGYLAG
jgi:hypothetical protein